MEYSREATSILRLSLYRRKLADAGTGSTFKALENRKLIETRYNIRFGVTEVRITRAGQECYREAKPKAEP